MAQTKNSRKAMIWLSATALLGIAFCASIPVVLGMLFENSLSSTYHPDAPVEVGALPTEHAKALEEIEKAAGIRMPRQAYIYRITREDWLDSSVKIWLAAPKRLSFPAMERESPDSLSLAPFKEVWPNAPSATDFYRRKWDAKASFYELELLRTPDADYVIFSAFTG